MPRRGGTMVDEHDVVEGLTTGTGPSSMRPNSRLGSRVRLIVALALGVSLFAFLSHPRTRLSIHVALCAGGFSPWRRNRRLPVRLVAHRGCEFPYPENSLPALAYGARNLKFVEMDIALTSDKKVVLMHDGTVDRTSNGTGILCEQSLASLERLYLLRPTVKPNPAEEPQDALPCPDASLPGAGTPSCVYRIPTLDLVFETLLDDVKFMLDLKVCQIPGVVSTSTAPEECNPCKVLAAEVKRLMVKHNVQVTRTVFTSTDVYSLSLFSKVFPKASFAFSVDHHFAAHTEKQFMRIIEDNDFDAVAMYYGTAGLRPDLVRAVRSSHSPRSGRKREVYAWTIRRKPQEHVAQCSGVDNLIVADPGLWTVHPSTRTYSCPSQSEPSAA